MLFEFLFIYIVFRFPFTVTVSPLYPRPLSRDCVNILTLIFVLFWGGRLYGQCNFSVKKSNNRENCFQCVSIRPDASDLDPSLGLDGNGHQSLF